ncbi:MAG: hypothetical protein JSS30_01235 [Verrucomicrobia bacterium]|nr:hypothetical protein [Verrucomicrobiota bacterium]
MTIRATNENINPNLAHPDNTDGDRSSSIEALGEGTLGRIAEAFARTQVTL